MGRAACGPAFPGVDGRLLRRARRHEAWLGDKELRRSDSNRRPSGYEPDELPLLHSAIELYPRFTPPSGEGRVGARSVSASEWAKGMRPAPGRDLAAL